MSDERRRALERELEAAGHGLVVRYVNEVLRAGLPQPIEQGEPVVCEFSTGDAAAGPYAFSTSVPLPYTPESERAFFELRGLSVVLDTYVPSVWHLFSRSSLLIEINGVWQFCCPTRMVLADERLPLPVVTTEPAIFPAATMFRITFTDLPCERVLSNIRGRVILHGARKGAPWR